MSCESLAETGVDGPVLVVLTFAVVFLLVGLVLLLRARRSGGAAATLLLVIIAVGGGVAVGLGPAPAASAAPTDCTSDTDSGHTTEPGEVTQTATEPEVENSLTITQTSTMADLAPGVEPKAITGLVVNNGPDDTFITAIVVDIVAVDRAGGAALGSCDATDYVLLDVRMPVGRALAPNGGSTDFAGAAIGFNNKSTNQDACQGATVQLRYRTSD